MTASSRPELNFRPGISQHYPQDQYVGVLQAQHFIFSENFYHNAAIHFPMKCIISKGHMGNSSASYFTNLEDLKTGDILVMNQRQWVMMSKTTGKAVSLSREAKAAFGEVDASVKPLYISTVSVPLVCFKYQCLVCPSDIDTLDHTNQSAYLRFSLDGAADAVSSKGRMTSFHGDIFGYKIKYIDALYQAETHVGDTLDVYVWEDEIRNDILYFQIMKERKSVFFSKMTFHGQLLKPKL